MARRHGGVHWPGIIAQAVGMVAAALWLNAYSPYVSPLSSRVAGSPGRTSACSWG